MHMTSNKIRNAFETPGVARPSDTMILFSDLTRLNKRNTRKARSQHTPTRPCPFDRRSYAPTAHADLLDPAEPAYDRGRRHQIGSDNTASGTPTVIHLW